MWTGSNIYCLDKNYGGVLIIWDRIFGTFAHERQDEDIIYGLVFNQPSFNVLHLQVIIDYYKKTSKIHRTKTITFSLCVFQTFYTAYVVGKFKQMTSWKHKLAVIFYGPSWQPGKPRLGLEQDKIRVSSIIK